MTYTDSGTRVTPDWMPLAMANGIEWSRLRRGRGDRFNNLYRRRLSINAALWYVGAMVAVVHEPAWVKGAKWYPKAA